MERQAEYLVGPAIEIEPARVNEAFDAQGTLVAVVYQPWVKFGVLFSRGPDSMNARLEGGQVKTFIAIALRIGEGQDCWPTIETIAEDSGQDSRTVQRHLYGWGEHTGLVAMGLIQVCQRPGFVNTYTVTRFAAYGRTPVMGDRGRGDTGDRGGVTPMTPKEEPLSRTIEGEPSSALRAAGEGEDSGRLQQQEGEGPGPDREGRPVVPDTGRVPEDPGDQACIPAHHPESRVPASTDTRFGDKCGVSVQGTDCPQGIDRQSNDTDTQYAVRERSQRSTDPDNQKEGGVPDGADRGTEERDRRPGPDAGQVPDSPGRPSESSRLYRLGSRDTDAESRNPGTPRGSYRLPRRAACTPHAPLEAQEIEYVDDPFETPKPAIVAYIEAESARLGKKRQLTPSQQGKLEKPVQQSQEYPSPNHLFVIDVRFKDWVKEQVKWACGANGDGIKPTSSLVGALRNYEREGNGWLDFRESLYWLNANQRGGDGQETSGGTEGTGGGQEESDDYHRQLIAAGLIGEGT